MDWYKIMDVLTPLLATLLVTLVSLGVYELKKYVKSKTDSQLMFNAVDAVGEAANAVVSELNATVVAELKKAGPLDKAKADKVKAEAVAKTKAMLTTQTIKVASSMIADLDGFVAGKIEEGVTVAKAK